MVFAIHQHESATGVCVSSPHPEPRSHLPLHPIPLGCPRALASAALLLARNLHWSSILCMVIYMSTPMFITALFIIARIWMQLGVHQQMNE